MATLRELFDADGAARADAPATAETQHTMAVGDVFLGNLFDSGDQDWVRVELQADTTYVIRLQGRGERPVADPLLELYDAEGERVAFNDDLCQGGSLDSKIVFTTPCTDSDDDAPLTYYINARSYSLSPALQSAGDYRLSLSEQQPLAAPDTPPTVPDALRKPVPTVSGANNTHIGTDADDILDGRYGADTLDGRGQPEDGIGDTASYYRAADAVRVSLAAGRGYTGEAKGDVLIDIENLIGSDYEDTLTGDSGDNILLGSWGDDTLDGGPGADLLVGGHGIDTVTYRYAYSTHGVRVDLALGVADGSAAEGDTLIGIENIIGSLQDDELYGNDTANRLRGHAGDDLLAGRGGRDVFVYYPDGGHDTVLDFEPGQDTLELHLYGDGPDWRELDIRTDGEDAVIRIDEDNSLTLSGGATLAAALSEEKHIVFVRETPPVRQATGQDDSDEGDDGADRGCVVGVTLTGDAGNNTLTGTDCDDVLDGKGGDDTLKGLDGNDTLTGGPGKDTLDGGEGLDDYAKYDESSAAVTIDLSGTQDGDGYITGSGGDAEGDKIKNIEHLVGSDHDDTLTGDANDNRLVGGPGKDTLDGGAGEDWAYYKDSGEGVHVDLNVSSEYATGKYGEAEGDKLKNIENLWGSDHKDTLGGDRNDNELRGGKGDDELHGADGDDKFYGGAGKDKLYGNGTDGAEGDYAVYSDSPAGVKVNLDTGNGEDGDAEGDWMVDIENLEGSAHDDTLTGNNLSNRLDGGGGNDTLTGLGGGDILTGGAGDDTFIFDDNDSIGITKITDFNKEGNDKINLRDFSLTGIGDDDLTIAKDGDDTVITATWRPAFPWLPSYDVTIRLEDMTSTLDADDFIFS